MFRKKEEVIIRLPQLNCSWNYQIQLSLAKRMITTLLQSTGRDGDVHCCRNICQCVQTLCKAQKPTGFKLISSLEEKPVQIYKRANAKLWIWTGPDWRNYIQKLKIWSGPAWNIGLVQIEKSTTEDSKSGLVQIGKNTF